MSVPMGWVSAVLKLGRKYQVSFIADEAIDRLKRAYPPAVTQFRLRGFLPDISDWILPRDGGNSYTLARSYGLNEILPFAFYLCCQLSVEKIVTGAGLHDGTVERLSRGDIVRCLSLLERPRITHG